MLYPHTMHDKQLPTTILDGVGVYAGSVSTIQCGCSTHIMKPIYDKVWVLTLGQLSVFQRPLLLSLLTTTSAASRFLFSYLVGDGSLSLKIIVFVSSMCEVFLYLVPISMPPRICRLRTYSQPPYNIYFYCYQGV